MVASPRPEQDCAQKLKVLADPTRLSVLEILTDGPKHVGEINRVLHLEQSLLSHHLKVLREAGLVEAVRDGKSVLYRRADSEDAGAGVIDLGCCRLEFPGKGGSDA